MTYMCTRARGRSSHYKSERILFQFYHSYHFMSLLLLFFIIAITIIFVSLFSLTLFLISNYYHYYSLSLSLSTSLYNHHHQYNVYDFHSFYIMLHLKIAYNAADNEYVFLNTRQKLIRI